MLKNKYFSFIISAGRTGTRFMGKKLSEMIDRCFSVHEPDFFTPGSEYNTIKKIETFGLYHLILGKIIGKTGIRKL